MKRTFVEPIIKRIELNLKENIAYSGDRYPVEGGGVFLTFYLNAEAQPDCNIINTGLYTYTVTKEDIESGKLGACFEVGAGAGSVSMMLDLS